MRLSLSRLTLTSAMTTLVILSAACAMSVWVWRGLKEPTITLQFRSAHQTPVEVRVNGRLVGRTPCDWICPGPWQSREDFRLGWPPEGTSEGAGGGYYNATGGLEYECKLATQDLRDGRSVFYIRRAVAGREHFARLVIEAGDAGGNPWTHLSIGGGSSVTSWRGWWGAWESYQHEFGIVLRRE